LPHSKKSGLVEAAQALRDVEGIGFCRFDEVDVIRHELVAKIIKAYKSHRGEKVTSMTL
jgi:phosphate starvation-inducible PhoH-like protein